MTDRELLELAAKAAGFKILNFCQEERDASGYGHVGLWLADTTRWNPLFDDGDALRLSVSLRIDLSLWINTLNVTARTHINAGRGISLHGANRWPVNDHAEPYADDPYAATRRAIVRAAAEIGKKMP